MDVHTESRPLRLALQGLVVLAFVTGGSAQISGWDDVAVQLLALPVLAFALWRIAGMPASAIRTVALAVAGLVVAVPLVQLLPTPESAWLGSPARASLVADLAVVGAAPEFRWSLDPVATERAFLFLLPPLGAFAATLTMRKDTHRRLLRLVMVLALASLLLAFLQLGVPAESVLNPFPQWAHQFNGVFANQNHQAIAMVLAVVIALAGMLSSLPERHAGLRQAWTPWVLGFLALFGLCALPLTQSRGAVLIGTVAVAVVPLAMGMFDRRRLRSGWGARLGLVASLMVIGLGVWATVGWMQHDQLDELRGPLREATAALGSSHTPTGAGMGAFVPAFAQQAPDALLLRNYVNHAHNEYAQWWAEGGWVAVLAGSAAILVLVGTAVHAWRREHDRGVLVAAGLGAAALLAHSWVDYPLRTPSLATIAAVLAGVVVARAAAADRHRGAIAVGGIPGERHTV